MSEFKFGDRVRILNDAPPYPRGSAGTVIEVHPRFKYAYSVVLDDDPDALPAAFTGDELEAES